MSDTNISSLKSILQQEQQYLLELLSIMETEFHAVSERDRKGMVSVLDRKLLLLSLLEQLDKNRVALFFQLTGNKFTPGNFQSFLDQQRNDTELVHTWDEIKHLLPRCKRQNDINERIVSVRKQNTEHILGILTGRPVTDNLTYSAAGKTMDKRRNAIYTSV